MKKKHLFEALMLAILSSTIIFSGCSENNQANTMNTNAAADSQIKQDILGFLDKKDAYTKERGSYKSVLFPYISAKYDVDNAEFEKILRYMLENGSVAEVRGNFYVKIS